MINYIIIGLAAILILIFLSLTAYGLIRKWKNDNAKDKKYWDKAIEFTEQEDFKGALEEYFKALEVVPDSPQTLYAIGKTYGDLNELDKAKMYLEKAIIQKERFPAAYHELGSIFHHKGQHDLAIQLYEKAITYNRKMIQSYLNIATIYRSENNHKGALEKYEEVLFINPRIEDAYLQKIDLLMSLNEYEKAENTCNEMLKKLPQNVNAYFASAQANFFLNKPDKIEKIKKNLAELNPSVAQELNELLKTLVNQKIHPYNY